MPNTGMEGAVRVAKKMCRAVKAIRDTPEKISVSIGLASRGKDDGKTGGKNYEEFIAEADALFIRPKDWAGTCMYGLQSRNPKSED
jgi:PleD family two-component response regulator